MNTVSIFGIAWAMPSFWWVSFVVGAILFFYAYRSHLVRKVINQFAGSFQSILVKNFSTIRQATKFVLLASGIGFLFLALLRPQWHKKEQLITQEGRDVLIALDISKSMLAQDCKPNRLESAKQKIRALLQQLDSDRVGLLLFAGSAFVQCPMTTDYSAFHLYLDHVDAETISSGSTALDAAMQEGLKLFGTSAKGKNKLMVICTDGEDFSSDLASAKQRAQQQGVRIFALGMGTPEGAPIPLYDDFGNTKGHQKDRYGKVVISHRNDGILQNLAHDLGGVYVPNSINNSDMDSIAKQVAIIEKAAFEDKKLEGLQDQYHWFLFAGLLLLLGEWVL